MNICGECRYYRVEVERGMIVRYYCNNSCSSNYGISREHTNGCSQFEEARRQVKDEYIRGN